MISENIGQLRLPILILPGRYPSFVAGKRFYRDLGLKHGIILRSLNVSPLSEYSVLNIRIALYIPSYQGRKSTRPGSFGHKNRVLSCGIDEKLVGRG